MKLLLAGGGTGGHIYPALAIAQALGEEPAAGPLEVLFAGSRDRLEAAIVPQNGFPIAFVSSAPLERNNPFASIATAFRNAAGILQSLGVLHRFRPDCVVATGGYVAFPVVVAARMVRAMKLSRLRIGLLEPNARGGLTNRLLAPMADEVWLSHAAERGTDGKAIVTGTPVRASFRETIDPAAARRSLGLDAGKTTIVVFGGSQGARSINTAIDRLRESSSVPAGWQIFHVSGASAAPFEHGVLTRPYVDDPRIAYAAADLVVARAGASTLAELAASGVPALLIPYPHATADHQLHNARSMERLGAARLLADAELSPERLIEEIAAALEPATFDALRSNAAALRGEDAARTIARRILSLCTRGSARPLANRAHP